MRKALYLLLLLAPILAHAQVVGPGFVYYVTSAPSGNCSSSSQEQVVYGTGSIYTCQSGTWAAVSGGGGGGANTALSNLAAVAINTSLLPASAVGAQKLGSASFPFGDVNLYQTANGDDLIYGIANTSTSSTGNFLHFQQPGSPASDEFLVDVNGNITGHNATLGGTLGVTGLLTASSGVTAGSGSAGGLLSLPCNTAQTFTAGSINISAPTSCSGTQSYTFPSTAASGVLETTNTSGAMVMSIVGTTGTGSVVQATSPTLVTPTLGAATATTINKVTLTAPATGSTLTIADGKTLTASNSITLAGTDSTTMTFPSASATITQTIASGTSAMGTGAISSAACATVVTTTATGTATTDVVLWGFNGDPTSTTGYSAATAGMLTIIAYPSSGNVNFKVCNNTTSSITPGAITLNWRIVR